MLIFLTAAALADCPERSVWPSPDWPAAPDAPDPEAIAALEAYAFAPPPAEEGRVGVRTDGVLILRGGQVVYERYGRGYTAATPHLLWSATKSFTSALTGAAVLHAAVSIDDSICRYVSGPEENCAITLEHLLTFSSGLDWAETYEGASPRTSSVIGMLYGEGRADMASFVLSHPLRDVPGTQFSYSSGDTTLLAGALKAALEPTYGEDYAWTLLLDPIGITSASWERDGAGVLVGSSSMFLTPRDFARLGYLYLSDGCWDGERLLPEGWVEASTTPSAVSAATGPRDDRLSGRSWWLNRSVDGLPLPWPDVPEGTFAAQGHWKQAVYAVPSEDIVIVRTADDRDGTFDHNRFLSLALAVVR